MEYSRGDYGSEDDDSADDTFNQDTFGDFGNLNNDWCPTDAQAAFAREHEELRKTGGRPPDVHPPPHPPPPPPPPKERGVVQQEIAQAASEPQYSPQRPPPTPPPPGLDAPPPGSGRASPAQRANLGGMLSGSPLDRLLPVPLPPALLEQFLPAATDPCGGPSSAPGPPGHNLWPMPPLPQGLLPPSPTGVEAGLLPPGMPSFGGLSGGYRGCVDAPASAVPLARMPPGSLGTSLPPGLSLGGPRADAVRQAAGSMPRGLATATSLAAGGLASCSAPAERAGFAPEARHLPMSAAMMASLGGDADAGARLSAAEMLAGCGSGLQPAWPFPGTPIPPPAVLRELLPPGIPPMSMPANLPPGTAASLPRGPKVLSVAEVERQMIAPQLSPLGADLERERARMPSPLSSPGLLPLSVAEVERHMAAQAAAAQAAQMAAAQAAHAAMPVSMADVERYMHDRQVQQQMHDRHVARAGAAAAAAAAAASGFDIERQILGTSGVGMERHMIPPLSAFSMAEAERMAHMPPLPHMSPYEVDRQMAAAHALAEADRDFVHRLQGLPPQVAALELERRRAMAAVGLQGQHMAASLHMADMERQMGRPAVAMPPMHAGHAAADLHRQMAARAAMAAEADKFAQAHHLGMSAMTAMHEMASEGPFFPPSPLGSAPPGFSTIAPGVERLSTPGFAPDLQPVSAAKPSGAPTSPSLSTLLQQNAPPPVWEPPAATTIAPFTRAHRTLLASGAARQSPEVEHFLNSAAHMHHHSAMMTSADKELVMKIQVSQMTALLAMQPDKKDWSPPAQQAKSELMSPSGSHAGSLHGASAAAEKAAAAAAQHMASIAAESCEGAAAAAEHMASIAGGSATIADPSSGGGSGSIPPSPLLDAASASVPSSSGGSALVADAGLEGDAAAALAAAVAADVADSEDAMEHATSGDVEAKLQSGLRSDAKFGRKTYVSASCPRPMIVLPERSAAQPAAAAAAAAAVLPDRDLDNSSSEK